MKTAKRHGGALLLALVVGATCVAPFIAFRHSGSYRSIELMGSDAEPHYVARIAQVYEHHLGISDTFLLPQNLPYLEPPLGENLVAWLGQALHLSAPAVTVAGKFLFPFLAALLLYALVYLLFRSRMIALIGVAVTFFCDALTTGPSAWKALLQGTSTVTSFLPYARPINPEISSLFLFVGMIFLYRGWYARRSPQIIDIVVTAAAAGLSFYVSPYPSSFLFGVLGLTMLWAFARKRYAQAIGALASFALGAAMLVPYLLNYRALVHSPLYADVAARLGVTLTHAPLLGVWLFVLLLLLLVAWPKRFAKARPFVLMCTIALFILTNQQVVTGHELQPGHYHWYITKALLGIVLGMYAVVCAEFCIRRRALRFGFYAAALLFCLYAGVAVQRASYRANQAQALQAQAYVPVLQYLNAQPAGQSVFANRDLSLYIPMYTPDAAPNNSYAVYYLVPEQFFVERMLLEYKLQGVPPTQIRAKMQADRTDIAQRLFGDANMPVTDVLLSQYAAQYTAGYAEPVSHDLKSIGSTYVVWDAQADRTWRFDHALVPVFTAGSFTVYRVMP